MRKLQIGIMLFALLASSLIIFGGNRASAQVDFTSYIGSTISDIDIDGNIGPEWLGAGHFTSILIDPSGTAEIWTKHDADYLYFAVMFTADSADPWIALQLGTTGCMDNTADVAIFGDNDLAANGYSDAYFPTGSSVAADATQHGIGALNVSAGNLVTIELKKPLNSGDATGKDISWVEGNTYNLVIAWDSNGGGSSGGSASHRSDGPTARNMLISHDVIPEFTTWMLVAALVLATVAAVAFNKVGLRIPRPSKKL